MATESYAPAGTCGAKERASVREEVRRRRNARSGASFFGVECGRARSVSSFRSIEAEASTADGSKGGLS